VGSDAGGADESIFSGTLDGLIISERRGENGFGYDPVFFIPELKRTAAELTRAEKLAVSHRGKALDSLRAHLESLLKDRD
jgi:XTP/dITP diphosphohydrolase